nr:MAG TPA: hypothetical protein [Caudoviricetes sp.]
MQMEIKPSAPYSCLQSSFVVVPSRTHQGESESSQITRMPSGIIPTY